MWIRPRSLLILTGAAVAVFNSAWAQEAPGGAAGPNPPSQNDAVPLPSTSAAAAAASPAASGSNPAQLAEVVVTANKRKESTHSVAGAVTAITGDQMSTAGANNLGEYLSLSPGVTFDAGVPGYSVITVRGVSSDSVPGLTQSAVGTYYDDIALTDPSAPLIVPDIDSFDAARVEVLRGPQGALYGSASLGGAVNYIPNSPDPTKSEISAFGSGDLTKHSSLGGTGKFMFNTPLFSGAPLFNNGLALRVVGYYKEQPGYIDNLGTGVHDSNATATRGGRAVLGWNTTENSTLRLSALYQKTTVDDAGYLNPSLGEYDKSTIVAEPSSNDFWLGSLRYELNTGFGTGILIGSYQEKHMALAYDGATDLGVQSLGQQVPLTQNGHSRTYSGELRVVSPSNPTFNWIGGLSYIHHIEDFSVDLNAQTLQGVGALASSLSGDLGLTLPGTLAATTALFDENASIRAPEEAIFFEGSYRFFRDLKLTAGGREYRNTVDSQTDSMGLLLSPSGSTVAQAQNAQVATGFNPKASLSYDVTRDAMVYALYSRGYRLGGPNLVPITPLTNARNFYNPDEVRNVEFGVKTRWWHRRLNIDIAAYDIGWTNIPLVVEDSLGVFKYIENAGSARAKGVETAIALHPYSFITARSAISYSDARLKNDFNPNNGRPEADAGTQLPGAPNWTATNTLTGQWEWSNFEPTVTLIHRYVSGSPSNISYTDVRVGNYQLLDVRAGLKFWGFGLTFFAKNVTDKRAVTAVNNQPQETSGDVLSLTFIQPPRTIGIDLTYSFESK